MNDYVEKSKISLVNIFARQEITGGYVLYD
jgi:hypothetical protein